MKLNRFILPIVIVILTLLLPFVSFTQHPDHDPQEKSNPKIKGTKEKKEKEKITKWEFGINFGTYFANRYTANFYNGSEENVNTISYVMGNKYWYEEIAKLLQSSDTIIVVGMPANMHYHVAIMGGLFFRYNFTKNVGIFTQFDYTQLKTDDEFTVQVDPENFLTEPDYRNFGIHGREERVNMDLGAHIKFPVYKNKMNLFVQAGMNVNWAQVMKNYINFYDNEYSIVNIYGSQNYVPNSNLQENQPVQGGFGYGLFAGGGMGFTFTPQIGLELGGYLHYIKVDLEGYNQFKPSGGVYVRFLLSNLINREED